MLCHLLERIILTIIPHTQCGNATKQHCGNKIVLLYFISYLENQVKTSAIMAFCCDKLHQETLFAAMTSSGDLV